MTTRLGIGDDLMPYDIAVVVLGVVVAELLLDVIRRARKRAHMRHLNRLSVRARERARAPGVRR